MLTLRFTGAFWLLHATFALRPTFTRAQLEDLWAAFPALALGTLVLETLPAVAAAASVARWLRARADGHDSPLAVATRAAAILGILGLLLPLHAPDAASATSELAFRAGQFLGLLLLIDGGLAPDE